MTLLLSLSLRSEADIVHVRKRTRELAELLKVNRLGQTQFATAVSEAARNAVRHATGGQVKYYFANCPPFCLKVTIEDKGPGIADVKETIERPGSLGLRAFYRLADDCQIKSIPGRGTTVSLSQYLPLTAPLPSPDLTAITDQLLSARPLNDIDEVRSQNAELILTLQELKQQREIAHSYQLQLEDLNKELADTNRGVIALNLELEEQARTIKDASDVKARFLSQVTHEFRTPVNSILSMSRILLNDGENLNADERRQMNFIQQAAEGLSEMVNDLLDTVKADAKKLSITLGPVRLSDLFDTLKAMFRPILAQNAGVELVFEDNFDFPLFISDETKISQILRNFISNATKFTPKGRVTVRAKVDDSHRRLIFEVEDTGIGIPIEEQSKIFEEFYQVQGFHQMRVKGTGLGLPLARKFARLLSGDVGVSSKTENGSVFYLDLPFERYQEVAFDGGRELVRILVIDDEESSHVNLRNLLQDYPCEFAFALNGEDGLRLAEAVNPDLIILDMRMPGLSGLEVLRKLRGDERTKSTPVFLNSSLRITFDDFKPHDERPDAILQKDELAQGRGLEPILSLLKFGDRHV